MHRFLATLAITILSLSACHEGLREMPTQMVPEAPSPRGTPTLSSVLPSQGPSLGGIKLSLTGTNFASDATVLINDRTASHVAVWSSTLIDVELPPNPEFVGYASVVVQNPDGQRASRSDLFQIYSSQPIFGARVYETGISRPFMGGCDFVNLILTADFNNDQKADLAFAGTYSNVVSVLIGDGSGFKDPIKSSVIGFPQSFAVADFQ